MSPRIDVEMGNSSSEEEECDDINDSQLNEYKELTYKYFQFRTHRLRCSNGGFGCPFCDFKEEHENRHIHLLLHAIRVAEEGSGSRKQIANHFAMAKYLAIDLAHKVKSEAERISRSRSEDGESRKRPRLDDDTSKGEMNNADRVLQLEKEVEEMTDLMNSVISRERQSNDELLRCRKELMKCLDEILRGKGNYVKIGIKRMGDIDSKVFLTEMEKRFSPEIAAVEGLELCSSWQENLKNPEWHPYRTIVDDKGESKRLLNEDDPLLQGLKEEWGQQVHDAVVEALNELQEYNPSGGYAVRELWNFEANRKAELDEVVSCILEAVKDGGSTLNEESCTRESEIYEHKERMYELLKTGSCKKGGVSFRKFSCPFCLAEEDRGYDYLLRHALMVAECSSSDAQMRGKHFALAKYLVIDLRSYAIEKDLSGGDSQDDEPSQSQSARSSPACGSDEEDSESVEETSEMNTDEEDEEINEEDEEIDEEDDEEMDEEDEEMDEEDDEEMDEEDEEVDEEDEEMGKEEAYENLMKEKRGLQCSFRNLLAREAKSYIELEGAREELIKVLKDRQIDNSSEIGIKQMGEIDLNVVKRACSKRFRASEVETAAVALCSAWQEKLKDTLWRPFWTIEDEDGKLQILVKKDESLGRLKQIWGDEIYGAVVAALEDLYEYCPTRDHTVAELWNFKENRKAELKEAIRYMVEEREGERKRQGCVSALLLLSKSSDGRIEMTGTTEQLRQRCAGKHGGEAGGGN